MSEKIGFQKPDHRIFHKALVESNSNIHDCIMVGDRLDIDIMPANELGMITIRTLDSLVQNSNADKQK